ncbi:TetR family transcriptional regulator [Kocuria tytonicola]|uniref:TetR/AcrR family transcriptional regulator n=1 Tax=Kocuria tytonicola TaxID=2055946 RepID=A0A3L9M436_9MICC|nr:TetR/AcrR family transcriptional regulator [Kocuria tytonicola]RLY93704.1 TetR/AcrR family transcriptional regulator [Kocuria tytonicola]RLZ03343.1 TetR family transcriptional regulator [Kocuria tytonicola]
MSNQTDTPRTSAAGSAGDPRPVPAETATQDGCRDRRSRSATRLKLIRSAPAVFAQQGIDGASVSDLCAAAGYTRGAFYSNFESKQELAIHAFDDLTTQLEETLGSELDHWLGSGLDVEQVVTRVIEGVTGQVANLNQQALRVELSIAAFRSPQLRERMAPIRERLYQSIEHALVRVAASQHLAFTVPPGDVARMLLTSYSGQLTDHMAMGNSGRGAQRIIPTMWLAFTRPA